MFDIGWQELFLISVVALIVVGPKDLPKVLRTGARMLNKARAMSREFQAGLAEIAREAELDELKRNVERATHFDPAEELKRAVDPTGKFTEDFDPMEFNRKLKAAVEGGPQPGRRLRRRTLRSGFQARRARLRRLRRRQRAPWMAWRQARRYSPRRLRLCSTRT
ncbi:MAG: twin-arginine translocase subunit TatB [Defluviicoccus sp.]|nr:MAG: twin-arginine translocase subunit TatB [Defluviicoccus sp.]